MLIIANIIFFFITFLPDFSSPYWFYYLLGSLDSPSIATFSSIYGLIPNVVLQGSHLFTFFTSMFLHANIIHLGGNMLFLYVFGDNVEDTFGRVRYLVFYFASGIAASLAHIFSVIIIGGESLPTIGASGAISGVLGAYLVLYPRAKILSLVFFFWITIIAVPAVVFLGVWFAYQFLYVFLLGTAGGVAYGAHMGVFLAGILFGVVWRGRRRKRVL